MADRNKRLLWSLAIVASVPLLSTTLEPPAQTAAAETARQTSSADRGHADEPVQDFMKIKLAAINAAMEAAATNDYTAVEKAGLDLIQLSRQVAWQQRANAAYLQDTADFVAAARYMVRMAQAEDSQGIAQSYGAVAVSCLNCHRHVRAPKIAQRDPVTSIHGFARIRKHKHNRLGRRLLSTDGESAAPIVADYGNQKS